MRALISKHLWWVLAAGLVVVKLALVRGQPIYAIGNAVHDDQLFLKLAHHIVQGEWLGPYDELTLAKGPIYSLFIAANHLAGLPLGLTQHLVYLVACATLVVAVAPLVTRGWARFGLFAVMWVNPMTYEGEHMSRILRQHLTIPFALIIAAALLALSLRLGGSWRRRFPWALVLGLTLGLFWLTREEGVWIAGMVLVLSLPAFSELWRGPAELRRISAGLLATAVIAGALPIVVVCSLNRHYYGWFGTVEFRGADFRAAYGALARVQPGPPVPYFAVTREARELAYTQSPAFAELQPFLEGDVGLRWADRTRFAPAERQISSGWFMWALREAVAKAGHARSAKTAMDFYRRMAGEINAACAAGRLPAVAGRSGFFPRWHPAYTRALLQEGPVYVTRALAWEGFEPNPPYSVGTDDEVRLFRDLTHDRISPSPQATHIELPDQRELQQRKIDLLRRIGRGLIPWLSCLVALAHVVAALRLVQQLRDRRCALPWWLAGGIWSGAAGTLAVNVLVHTTSFPNFYPAAFAPGYALLLLFAALALGEAAVAWRHWPSRVQGWLRPRPLVVWALGAGLIVLAARTHEAWAYADDAPFLDQWKVEAQEIIAPWIDGAFSLGSLFAPHHEHMPLWTRLFALAQAALGTWDPKLQMFVNAACHATWIALLAAWFRRHLPFGACAAGTAAAVLVASLPHAWENMTWGFQSQFPLALLCAFIFARDITGHDSGSGRWWLALAVGCAGIFTLGGFWTIFLLVPLVELWLRPAWQPQFAWLLGLAAIGAGIMLACILGQPAVGTLALYSSASTDFLHTWFHQLGWPLSFPGAALWIQLPLVILLWRARGNASLPSVERILSVLGLWSAVLATGVAFARGSLGADFVSRYADLLAVGLVVNLAILLRWTAHGRASRWALVALWIGPVLWGLHEVNTHGHAAYFHAHAAERAAYRQSTIRDYLRDHEAAHLSSESTRSLIYPDPNALASLLDQPSFVRILPAVVGGSAPAWGRFLLGLWPWFGAAGLLIWFLALRPYASSAAPPVPPAPHTVVDALLPAGIGAAAFCALWLWNSPFLLDQSRRWQELLAPAAPPDGYAFSFTSPSSLPDERLIGAAGISAEHLRNLFFGTSPDGPGFTGTIQSTPFKLRSPWLIIPYAGSPANPGNGMHLVIVDPYADGKNVQIDFAGTNPIDVGFWLVDVTQFPGANARLVLADGESGDKGWLAAAPPLPALSAGQGAAMQQAWNTERSARARFTLMGLALIGAVLAAISCIQRRAMMR